MRILLIGEASFLNNTLKAGLKALGHTVVTMSDGNNWHDAPRDIDLRRTPRWGRLGGVKVAWQIVRHLPRLVGNDIVEVHNYQFVPLRCRWNTLLFRFLKLCNRRVVKGCFGDDPQIFRRQQEGVPRYSDTYWLGQERNRELNRGRVEEVTQHGALECWRSVTARADRLMACLYEYWLCYDQEPYRPRLRYLPLPIITLPEERRRVKGGNGVVSVLVGIQPKRDFMKGASVIARWVEDIRRRHPQRIYIRYVEGVPYGEYMRMLEESDVLVDQLYSFTPSMNSLAAMARGTVVIGGGEEDYYRFIGEERLRPIINVSPELSGQENIRAIERALLSPETLRRMSRESMLFVDKYHDARKVAEEFVLKVKN